MTRLSLLRWIAIAAFSISITLLLLSLNHHSSTAAKTKTQAQEKAGLHVMIDGKAMSDCPLKHTDVKAEVSGFLSRVTVTQEFENPYTEKIEAVYTFPLPAGAAVDDLTMHIGNRVIKGKIMRREEARAAYESAKSLGKAASLLDQERPNIFTQSVANIMPGQPINVTISYVETLKYSDGSYEWSFPMGVARRYIPDSSKKEQPAENEDTIAGATDSPQGGMPGHGGRGLSLEVTIDAGVPVEKLSSKTHEIELARVDDRRAVVRLKDQEKIPNKDFVLRYKVSGQKIEDAVLAHRTREDGFFTLILQPPERVAADDVMPKELVFVVDTSGSMEGLPLNKAKETINLALGNLYPHDTFNLITFAGDTAVLFPEPVLATPENLARARDFLADRKGGGGTEMMGAIRAALDPSDSQQHVRIACFLTDGVVGNDNEILAEVQKHPNARVFALGFSDSPNRYLLDKMAEYGRGEVEYVPEKGNASNVVRRFHERVRNPLLTDLKIEWVGLEISDVYPKRIPDLFSAKPVMLTGRYTKGGKGTLRLRGMMAGQPFVREIPVELPDKESSHDVLETLWGRQRIEELMGQIIVIPQADEKTRTEIREEITQLGLKFKLMTQFTSFVAIDELISAPPGELKRIDVPDEEPAYHSPAPATTTATAQNTSSNGNCVCETVTVTASQGSGLDTSANTSGSNIVTGQLMNLPLAGRSYLNFATLSSGVTSTTANSSLHQQGLVSVNGQRSTSNNYSVDGVSGNFGIAPGGENPGASAAGGQPALTASGGGNGLSSLEATQEIQVRSNSAGAEYGRSTGGIVNVVTKSGTNSFHGTLFQFFGNNAVDAGDWFANSRGLGQPARRLNNFGGTLGGPIKRNRLFFFSSYEGLRLRQPGFAITEVPSLASRLAAPAGIRPFLNAFPLPNGVTRPDGFAEFASIFSNPARHDLASLHLDDNLTSNTSIAIYYNFADSSASARGQGGYSLNTINQVRSRAHTLTGVWNYVVNPRTVAVVRGNYSRQAVHGSYALDNFGGALLPDASVASVFSRPDGSFIFDLDGRGSALMRGSDAVSTQRQFNLLGEVALVTGTHALKFGADYRRLAPIIGLRSIEEKTLFDGVGQALTGIAARVGLFDHDGATRPIFDDLSLYVQDEWKKTRHLTLTFGLRWEMNPAPGHQNGQALFAVTQVDDPAQLSLAPVGSPLWRTTYTNFAPRVAFAYELSSKSAHETVIRGGVGLYYELGQDQSGSAFADSYPILTGQSFFSVSYPLPSGPSPSATTIKVPFSAFDPQLKLPYAWQWNLSLQHALGGAQSITATYVGSAGRRLLSTQTLFDANPDFAFLRLTGNRATSDYHALQVQFNRRLSQGFTAMAAYTWSKSIDNYTSDAASRVLIADARGNQGRGPSDFDARHLVSGSFSYDIPALRQRGFGQVFVRDWSIAAIFNARSARPLNVVYTLPTSFGLAYLRPDLVSGAPLYISDPNASGQRLINPAAFVIRADGQQGTVGRNSLRGFPLFQMDMSLRRRFKLSDAVTIQLGAEAFNLLNHPNFADPAGDDLSLGSIFDPLGALRPNPSFGQSASLNGRGPGMGWPGAFGSFYSSGGPRSLRFSARLLF
jgi:hypothetical protein